MLQVSPNLEELEMNTNLYVRPLTTSELFNSAFTLYKNNFGKFFLINLVQVLANFLALLFSFFTGFVGGFSSAMTNNPILKVIGYIVGLLPSFATVFVAAAMLIAISNAILGRPVQVGGSYRRAWSGTLIWKMLIVSLPFSLIYIGIASWTLKMIQAQASWLVIVIECLILTAISIILAFIAPIVVLEKLSAAKSFTRLVSLFWSNVRRLLINYGVFWFIPIYLLSIFLTNRIAFPITNALTADITDIPTVIQISFVVGLVVGFLVSSIIGLFLNPFGSLLSTLLYYDTRARKENYDQELLAQEMGYEVSTEMITV
jgi:hypothetical protein